MAKQAVQCKVKPEVRQLLNDYLAQTGRKESNVVEELVNGLVDGSATADPEHLQDLTDQIESLSKRLDSLHDVMRLDMVQFFRVILLKHRNLFSDAELTERQVNKLIREIFPQ